MLFLYMIHYYIMCMTKEITEVFLNEAQQLSGIDTFPGTKPEKK